MEPATPQSAARANAYGSRARIGYTCPPRIAEIFPYEFYKLVPPGVTLVITTLSVTEPSAGQVDQAYDMSLHATRELAAAGVDIVFLGGVPVNLARGRQNAGDILRILAAELGVKVSSSTAAQEKAAKTLGCRNVAVAHPYAAREDARLIADAERYGCKVLGAMGWGKVIAEFGRIREYPAAPVPWLSDVTDARYVVSDMMSKIVNDNMAIEDAQKWAQDQMMDSYNKIMKKA